MQTKEEIIRSKADGWVGGMTFGDEERIVYPAMDEWAKQQAIKFAKWIPHNAVIAEDEYYFELLKNGIAVDEEELYELFLSQNK